MSTLSKKAAQGHATRQALFAAARQEFGSKGYTDAAIDKIVSRAAVTKGAFYHHFSGKEDLFLRVFENVKKELGRAAFVTHVDHEPFAPPDAQQRQLNPLAEQSNAEVWSQLLQRCRRYVELHADPRVRRIVLVDARWVLSWQDLQRIEAEYGVILLRADLRRAMQRRIVKRLPLHTLATILAGALNEACLMIANATDSLQTLDDAMTVIEHMLEGLREPSAPSSG